MGRTLHGEARCQEETCSIHIDRRRVQPTIEGKPIESGEVAGIDLQITAPDSQGRSLCLGEVTLLEGEVPDFVRGLSRLGIRVSAIHNHWMEDRPRLIYLHFQAVMNPERLVRSISPLVQRLS